LAAEARSQAEQAGRAPAAEPRHLHVTVRLYNTGTAGRVSYRGLSPAGRAEASLRDPAGNLCPQLPSPGGGGVEVRRRAWGIAPFTHRDVTLVFEVPPREQPYFRLELAVGAEGAGPFRFQIPHSMITWR
jgi:hypothetical protein